MKTFIIHIPNKTSIEYANKALESFSNFSGWEPELFTGITQETLPEFEKQYPLPLKKPSRAAGFYELDRKLYTIKKCCSMNHYRLFKKCIELKENITIIEHDAHCVSDYNYIQFDDILVLNITSALQQKALNSIRPLNLNNTIPHGVANININGLVYRHDIAINGKHIMPGTASYAVTPEGAQKMIKIYESIGWEQSDFIINTAYVRIQTIMPELFTFKLPNLSMSHGHGL